MIPRKLIGYELLDSGRGAEHKLISNKREWNNRPFAAGGQMVQNPKYWIAKEFDKTPLGNINKEK